MNGATERSAQQSAQGKLQDLGYKADFPIILNVDGIATYFMPMKDSAGLIKQYAFVSVENYSSVGTGGDHRGRAAGLLGGPRPEPGRVHRRRPRRRQRDHRHR